MYALLGPIRPVVEGTTNVLLSAHTRASDPQAVDLVHDCLKRADRARLRNAIISVSLHREDLADVLPQVSAPTLIATGTDHSGFTPDQARAAARLLPRGSVAIVPDAAFLLPLEAPDTCTDLVQQHWAKHSASSPSL